MMSSEELPPIEEWWPSVQIPTKHWLFDHADEPLPAKITDDISAVTGVELTGEPTLSKTDRQFIATQSELID